MERRHEDRLLFLKQFVRELMLNSTSKDFVEEKLEGRNELGLVLKPISIITLPQKKKPIIKLIKPVKPTLHPSKIPALKQKIKITPPHEFKLSLMSPTKPAAQAPIQPNQLPSDFVFGKLNVLGGVSGAANCGHWPVRAGLH